MDQQQIKSFIDAMAKSDLSEMEFSENGWSLRLVRRTGSPEVAVAPGAPEAPAQESTSRPTVQPVIAAEITAPLYGVVHLRASPDEPLFVEAGQPVRAGQMLCVIEAMKVFNEVRAERDAVVEAVLVASGQEVDAGQPLFRFA